MEGFQHNQRTVIMIVKHITLPAISPELLEDFKAYLPYCAEGMISFKATCGKDLDIEFTCASEHNVPVIESAIRKVLDAMGENGAVGPVEKRIVFDNRSVASHNQREVFGELLRDGHLIKFGHGQYGMGKTFLQVFKYFERGCYRLALQQNPVEYVYPIMIPTRYLRQCGYFGEHPQSATFMAPSSLVQEPDHVGKSAVCLHCYPHFENQVVTNPVTLTTQGRCYRYGAEEMQGIENLWEFIMRESIYMGSADYVRERLGDIRRLTTEWMARLGINCWIEAAGDPFYAERPDVLRKSRLIKENKYELRCNLPKSSVAVASFNFHGPHFSKAFNITDGGNYIATGCAGFGIERLTYAFLSQYGLDSWPRHIQNEVLAKS